MGTLQSGIELYDGFSPVLNGIMNSINATVSVFEDLQRVSSNEIDTGALERAEKAANNVMYALNALQGMQGPQIDGGGITAQVAAPVEAPVVWKSDTLDVFTDSGVERFQQEIQSANSMLERLSATQTSITQQAQAINILPPEAIADIQNLQNRVQDLQAAITEAEQNTLDVGGDEANAQLERLRGQLAQALTYQENLNTAMQGMNAGDINSAFLQLSQNVGNVERSVRDSFSQPIEVPVTWKSDTLDVFTNSGVERFQQEIQSATNMVNTLNQAQQRISAQAAATNIFPPKAVADLNNMQNRIQVIQNRITQIADNPINMGSDTANRELEQLRVQLHQTIAAQEALNSAVENMDVQAANDAYNRLSQIVGGTERNIRDNVDAQARFNQEIARGANESGNLLSAIKRIIGAYITIQTAGKVIDLSDAMTQTSARLALIVDDGGSVEELQNKIYLSAQNARGAYMTTADAISKLGTQASQAFNSNDELIAFTELLNKQFVNTGTSVQGIDSVMLQLTQSMASGKLQGEELNAVLDNAAPIVQNIQQYLEEVMGIDAGNIKDLASDGVITAEIIKNALFYAADEINAKFDSMPQTFSQVWTSFKNTALMEFQPVLMRLNEIANSETFQSFASNAASALSVLAGVVLGILDWLTEIADSIYIAFTSWEGFPVIVNAIETGILFIIGVMQNLAGVAANVAQSIISNWSWIGPIVYGVAAVVLIYQTYTLLAAAATTIWTGAQAVFNAIMAANPVFLIVTGIIALITAITAAIRATDTFGSQSVSVLGTICGMVNVAIQFFANLGLAVANIALGIWNALGACCDNIGTAFHNTIVNVQGWFYDLLSTALTVVENICAALNKLPFVSFDFSGITAKAEEYAAKSAAAYGGIEDYVSISDAFDEGFNSFNAFSNGWAQDAFDSGASFGDGILDGIGKFIDDIADSTGMEGLLDSNVPNADDYANTSNYDAGLTGIGSDVSDIAGNTGSIADSLDVTDEELKYLRDIAERDTINRFTIAEVAVDMGGIVNQVNDPADLDGLVDGIVDGVNEAIDIATEGVHT